MAQKTEKEETEFKVVPESITPCINNCGVTGNQATNNMCQKCFNATTAGSSGAGTSAVCGGNSMIRDKSPKSSSPSLLVALRSSDPAETSGDLKKEKEELKEDSVAIKRTVNRCSGCRRKVGLTGFRCRCGELFCAEHRYSDRHDCSYDYKSAGRDAIARENPVVKAAKIVKI